MGLSYLSCRLTTIILSCCASWNQSLLFSNFEESQDDNNIGLMKPHMDNIACFHPYLNTFIQKKNWGGYDDFIHEKTTQCFYISQSALFLPGNIGLPKIEFHWVFDVRLA